MPIKHVKKFCLTSICTECVQSSSVLMTVAQWYAVYRFSKLGKVISFRLSIIHYALYFPKMSLHFTV